MIDHNIDVQSVVSWAPKVVRKCESRHWFSCGADGKSLGRSVGIWSRDYKIFWDGLDYLAMWLLPRARSPPPRPLRGAPLLLSFEILRSVHTCVRDSRTPFYKISQGDFIDDCGLNASQACVR